MRSNDGRDNMTNTSTSSSGVDGIGLFKSWRDSYDNPKNACLDLIDNCFDATLPPQQDRAKATASASAKAAVPSSSAWKGKVAMHYVPSTTLAGGGGFVIINNGFKHFKPLASILTAYRSEKSARGDGAHIGEYGVGLKQAVATLSDCNFILTRSGYVFELGVVASKLQTKNSVVLPYFSFSVDPSIAANNTQLLDQTLKQSIADILKSNPDILKLAVDEFTPDSNPGTALKMLLLRFQQMLDDDWKSCDRVFQVVVCNLIHTLSESSRTSSGIQSHPAKHFLREIRDMLPKYYINIPRQGFDFFVEDEPLQFTYWQNRLVEMTKFEVNIPKETPIQYIDDDNWVRQGYDLSIYCGFDALRVEDVKNQAQTCQLCIYSRQSGRLIEVEADARNSLGMPSSGVDFSQGLTVIVDDSGGNLPLKPTKDGLTWSKEPRGEVHKSNLLAWVGAVGYLYWKYHAANFEKVGRDYKTLFKEAVLSFVQPIRVRLKEEELMAESNGVESSDVSKRLEDAKFTMFSEVTWKKIVSSNSKKLTIRKKMLKLDACPGPATIFRFDDSHRTAPASAPRRRGSRPKKRKAGFVFGNMDPLNAPTRQPDTPSDESSSGSEEEELGELKAPATPTTDGGVGEDSNWNPPVDDDDNNDTGGVTGISETTAQLRKELLESKEREQHLESELRTAKMQLGYQPRACAGLRDDSMDSQQVQKLRHENELLRKEKAQLERNLQTLKEDSDYQVERLKLDMSQLQLQVQHQQTIIQRLQRDNGFGET